MEEGTKYHSPAYHKAKQKKEFADELSYYIAASELLWRQKLWLWKF